MIPAERVLYLPNESVEGDQEGARAAFASLSADGTIEHLEAFSFLVEARRPGGPDAAQARLVDMAAEFQPTVVFWQHISKFPLRRATMSRIKGLASRPIVAYHEGDVYGQWHKRPTPAMRLLAASSDVVFVVGMGANARLFKRMGAPRVLFSPSSASDANGKEARDPARVADAGVVMIANRFTSRLARLRVPGARAREKLAVSLHSNLGRRFVVHGKGWDGFPFNGGPVPYSEQEQVIRRHVLSVGWTLFDSTPRYFSDRLPIALLSSVPHATNYQPGYESMFEDGESLIWFHSVEEAVEKVQWLLSLPVARLAEIGRAGRALAKRSFTHEVVLRRLMDQIQHIRAGQQPEGMV